MSEGGRAGWTSSGPQLRRLVEAAIEDEDRRLRALEARVRELLAGSPGSAPAGAPGDDPPTAASPDPRRGDRDRGEAGPAATAEVAREVAVRGASVPAPRTGPWASADARGGGLAASEGTRRPAAWSPPPARDLEPHLSEAEQLAHASGRTLRALRERLHDVSWEDPLPAPDPGPAAEDASARAASRGARRAGPWPDDLAGGAGHGQDDGEQGDHGLGDEPADGPAAPAPDLAASRPGATTAGPGPGDPRRFDLGRAFRPEAGEAPGPGGPPPWARALADGQAAAVGAMDRVEELLVELGRSVVAVLERLTPEDLAGAARDAAVDPARELALSRALELAEAQAADALARAADAEARAARAEHAARRQAERLDLLEGLLERLDAAPAQGPPPAPHGSGPAPTSASWARPASAVWPRPAPPPEARGPVASGGWARAASGQAPRPAQEPETPSARLRRAAGARGPAAAGSTPPPPTSSVAAARRALAEALAGPEGARGLRADLVRLGAEHEALVQAHAGLLERLVRLLEGEG